MDRPDRPRAYQAPASKNATKKTKFVNSTKIVQAPFGYAAQALCAQCKESLQDASLVLGAIWNFGAALTSRELAR